MQRTSKKLALSRETICELGDSQLHHAYGGNAAISAIVSAVVSAMADKAADAKYR